MSEDSVKVRVIFAGHVQGVFFRANAKRFADENGVKGWVRNTDGGAVEAVFDGDRRSVDRVIDLCKNNQPYARVESVRVEAFVSEDTFKDFSIRY